MLERLRNHKPTLLGIETFKKFAVCIPLLPGENGYEVLFEVRASDIGRQPGDVCFPGGKLEKDEHPKEGAVRETMEELLIEEEQLEILGPMDVYLTDYGNMVYPYAAVLRDYQGTCSQAEVEEIFTVPLEFFIKTKPEIYYTRLEVQPEEDFPFERINGGRNYPWRKRKQAVCFYTWEDRVIWGMTAKMMQSFAEIAGKNA